MWAGIKNFFSKAWVQWGLTLAMIAGVVGTIFKVNDFSRPPIPDPQKPQDFSKELEKIDPSKPIGVFVFNVYHGNWSEFGVNASRNNYQEKMREHYGDNIVIVDNPTPDHLKQFSDQFNARFGEKKPEVHFVANHHQGTYNDYDFAGFLKSIDAKKKRALILSCGPVSDAYKDAGCEYVMIPAPDGQVLGAELDLKISPAYRPAIGWLAEISDPEEARKKFAEKNFYNVSTEWWHRLQAFGAGLVIKSKDGTYKPPVVITPETDDPSSDAVHAKLPRNKPNPSLSPPK